MDEKKVGNKYDQMDYTANTKEDRKIWINKSKHEMVPLSGRSLFHLVKHNFYLCLCVMYGDKSVKKENYSLSFELKF